MKQRCEKLYQSLKIDVQECKGKFNCPKKEIEQCFIICNQYWAIVRHDIANYEFETTKEEIYFFKYLKPLFTTEVEYYSLFYHLHLFKSEVLDPVKIKEFLNREALRLGKFITENRSFYEYYKSGITTKDTCYFTRKQNISGTLTGDQLETKTVTSHDHLVSSLLALERYNEYVEKELREFSVDT